MNIQKQDKVFKVVAIGPESTGKSTICAALAAHFSASWCREYAREYLLENGTDYGYQDLLTIAKGQLKLEDQAIAEAFAMQKNPVLFIDTDMHVMKVWCEFVFGNCHPFILNEIVKRKYDAYLLCKPDLPWVKDELREYPDIETRDKLYHNYKDILVNQDLPWFEVHGQDPMRTAATIEWVGKLLK